MRCSARWAPGSGPSTLPREARPQGKGRSTRVGGWAQRRTTTRLPGGGQTPAQHRCTAAHTHRLLVTSWPGAAPGAGPTGSVVELVGPAGQVVARETRPFWAWQRDGLTHRARRRECPHHPLPSCPAEEWAPRGPSTSSGSQPQGSSASPSAPPGSRPSTPGTPAGGPEHHPDGATSLGAPMGTASGGR